MIKVKIFSETDEDNLQYKINEFIKYEKAVKDIKFDTALSYSDKQEHCFRTYNAMVIYEVSE
ncbi:MAG: sporulation protein Cse60 [Anaeromicrobium sp.]|jgi:hypothetical protein|uniref:sporulation protein Cse60 n=1 Tax=Anaeromicrobium sp. TaxID=1929132 RepID=UPI0025FA6DC6|nr:sporulation protein Cse60 [Anaeromicrobium sp.]MCT4593164.1 sporulation protein Cse60 [Anaeromicrobium sp.]